MNVVFPSLGSLCHFLWGRSVLVQESYMSSLYFMYDKAEKVTVQLLIFSQAAGQMFAVLLS